MVADETLSFVAEPCDNILQRTYEKPYDGVCAFIYNVLEQFSFDQQHRVMIRETLNRHISPYFYSGDAATQGVAQLFSINTFDAPIAAIMSAATTALKWLVKNRGPGQFRIGCIQY